jgi:hypothetical protein
MQLFATSVAVETLKVTCFGRASGGGSKLHSKCLCLASFRFWKGKNGFWGELVERIKIKFSCEGGKYCPVSHRRNIIPGRLYAPKQFKWIELWELNLFLSFVMLICVSKKDGQPSWEEFCSLG